jgi:hypothetical protein
MLQKYAKYLEINSWICNNDLSAFLRYSMYKDLSDGAPTPIEDRSFYFVLCHLEDKYRTRDCICQYHFRIFVRNICLYFMIIIKKQTKNYLCIFLLYIGSSYGSALFILILYYDIFLIVK